MIVKTLLVLLLLQGGVVPHLRWQPRASLPVAAAGGYSATLGGKIIYAGGSTWQNGVKRFLAETHVYDTATDRWSAGPMLPAPLAYGAFAHTRRGLEVYGGTGGANSSRDCWVLETAAGPWKPCGGDPGDTLLAFAQPVGDSVLIFGGCPNVTDLVRCGASVRQRSAAGRWTTVAEMPQGRLSNGASAVLNGSVYLFGGVSGKSGGSIENHADAYRFDVLTRRWTQLRPLPRPARGMTAIAWNSRYILLAGGYVASQAEAAGKAVDFGFSGAVHFYDTMKDEYQAAEHLPLACAGLALLRVGGGLVAMGGEDRLRARSAQVLWGSHTSGRTSPR